MVFPKVNLLANLNPIRKSIWFVQFATPDFVFPLKILFWVASMRSYYACMHERIYVDLLRVCLRNISVVWQVNLEQWCFHTSYLDFREVHPRSLHL